MLSRPKYKAWTKTLTYEGHLCLLSSLPTKNFGLFAHRFESFFLYSEKVRTETEKSILKQNLLFA